MPVKAICVPGLVLLHVTYLSGTNYKDSVFFRLLLCVRIMRPKRMEGIAKGEIDLWSVASRAWRSLRHRYGATYFRK